MFGPLMSRNRACSTILFRIESAHGSELTLRYRWSGSSCEAMSVEPLPSRASRISNRSTAVDVQ